MTYPSNDHHIDTHRQEYYGFDTAGGGGLNRTPYCNEVSEQIRKDFENMLNSMTLEKRKEEEEYHKQWETKNRYRYDYYN